MNNVFRRLYVLFEPAPAGWWKFWRMYRRPAKPGKRILTTLDQHIEGLAGKVSMWTYDGVNYWWLDGRLWSCRDRTDEERGISRPWSDEEKRQIEMEFLIMRFVIAVILFFDGIVIWLAFQQGG